MERIECFDCVFGVYSFALVLNGEVAMLGWLEWWWLGGIYSPQPLPSRCLTLLSMGTPDSPVVHRTRQCSLSGACHVSRPLGFGAIDRWNPLSFCCTGQFGARPDRHYSLSGAPLTDGSDSARTVLHCSSDLQLLQAAIMRSSCCSAGAPDSPVAHRTVR